MPKPTELGGCARSPAFPGDDLGESAPALLCAITMLLSFSITHGIAIGFIGCAASKRIAGKAREVPLAVRRVRGQVRVAGPGSALRRLQA